MLQDGFLLKFLENVVEGPFYKGITVEIEEQGFSKLKSINWLVGKQLLFLSSL